MNYPAGYPLSPHGYETDSPTTDMIQGSKSKPATRDIRQFHIEKTNEQLGIKIEEVHIQGELAGIFISSVTANSLASKVGLCVGDQLLEVCGINLRTAKYAQAAQVLHRTGKSIDIKVQYNPDKFEMGENSTSVESLYGQGKELSPAMPIFKSTPKRADSQSNFYGARQFFDDPKSKSSTLKSALNLDIVPTAHSTLISHFDQENLSYDKYKEEKDNKERGSCTPNYEIKTPQYDHEPRVLKPVLKKTGELGIRLVGGNAVGIFIHSVEQDSPAYSVGLQKGDQILEYNGTDLTNATAEQAAYELAKPVENVSILVQFNPDKYRDVKDEPGDSYFIRAMFDREAEENSSLQLLFKKDDILYVDNTMYNGVPGHWSAWILDKEGSKGKWGIIPSKYKVEESMLLKRTKGKTFTDGVYEFSSSTRRSFFKRRKGEMCNNESKELAVYSDVESLLSHSDSEKLHKQMQTSSYLRVEKRTFSSIRPVLILGPFADSVMDKLASDYPSRFVHCEPEYMNSDLRTVEKEVTDNIFLDFKRRGTHFECTTMRSIREIIGMNQHSMLDIHVSSVEKLHQNQIYPIVILIKFKSIKQMKEVKDPRYQADQLSQKDAKNIYEHSMKQEQEFRHLISEVIHAGANLMLICAQVAAKIDQEQKRPVWVPSGTIW